MDNCKEYIDDIVLPDGPIFRLPEKDRVLLTDDCESFPPATVIAVYQKVAYFCNSLVGFEFLVGSNRWYYLVAPLLHRAAIRSFPGRQTNVLLPCDHSGLQNGRIPSPHCCEYIKKVCDFTVRTLPA